MVGTTPVRPVADLVRVVLGDGAQPGGAVLRLDEVLADPAVADLVGAAVAVVLAHVAGVGVGLRGLAVGVGRGRGGRLGLAGGAVALRLADRAGVVGVGRAGGGRRGAALAALGVPADAHVVPAGRGAALLDADRLWGLTGDQVPQAEPGREVADVEGVLAGRHLVLVAGGDQGLGARLGFCLGLVLRLLRVLRDRERLVVPARVEDVRLLAAPFADRAGVGAHDGVAVRGLAGVDGVDVEDHALFVGGVLGHVDRGTQLPDLVGRVAGLVGEGEEGQGRRSGHGVNAVRLGIHGGSPGVRGRSAPQLSGTLLLLSREKLESLVFG